MVMKKFYYASTIKLFGLSVRQRTFQFEVHSSVDNGKRGSNYKETLLGKTVLCNINLQNTQQSFTIQWLNYMAHSPPAPPWIRIIFWAYKEIRMWGISTTQLKISTFFFLAALDSIQIHPIIFYFAPFFFQLNCTVVWWGRLQRWRANVNGKLFPCTLKLIAWVDILNFAESIDKKWRVHKGGKKHMSNTIA
jgi:hypothetical protein